MYSGLRHELDATGHVNPGLFAGRKRGVIFDVGHGGGSFAWRVAVPAIKEGFVPDSISTDLHIGSMNAGMKDQLNVMSKFLALGLCLDDVDQAVRPGTRRARSSRTGSATSRWERARTSPCCAWRTAASGSWIRSAGACARSRSSSAR